MKIAIKMVVLIIILLLATWFLVTQPLLFFSSYKNNPNIHVDSDLLKSHVTELSHNLPARIGIEQKLIPTIEWIEKQLKPFGNSYRQSFKVKDSSFHNILIDFGSTSAEGVIVVGAHYDTAHGFPGADDNASGVATLIELARLLSLNSSLLKNQIQLVFYPLEEAPFFRTKNMGSYIHASNLKKKNTKLELMISVEMVGFFSEEDNSQNYPFPLMEKLYSNKGNFIAIVGNLDIKNISAVRKVKSSFKKASKVLPVYSMNAPISIKGVDFSDHLNYWKFDYPAVMITDTAFMRNKNYHTKTDTVNTLDFKKMSEVVKSIYRVIISYDYK